MIPTLLPYLKKFFGPAEMKLLAGKACYYIEPYPLEGTSVIIYLASGAFNIRIGKFDGSILNVKTLKDQFDRDLLAKHVPKLIKLMKFSKIFQAQYFFSERRLVDVQVSLNKFIGPGMLKDLFGKILETQKIIKIAPATEEDMKGVTAVIKPSSFKTMMVEDGPVPLYCKI
jgi:hypothetical protein